MRMLRRLVPAVLALSLVASTLTGCDWPEGTRYVHVVFDGYDVQRGITYRTTTTHTGQRIDLKLDIYEPRGDTATERPVVMWMFGGSWQAGNRDQLAAYAQDSARRGYVGVTIDYRIRPREGFDLVAASNDAYEDAVAAIEWLAAHADQYDLDPDAIVPAGYSAGAINAVHALYRPADTPAAGAVAIAGMSFTGVSADRGGIVMFNGTEDQLVPYSLARQQCLDARAVDSPCRLVTYDGGDHFIGVTEVADIQAKTADFVFEIILWPLGYRPETVD